MLVPQKPVKRPGLVERKLLYFDLGGLAGWMGWGKVGWGKEKNKVPGFYGLMRGHELRGFGI